MVVLYHCCESLVLSLLKLGYLFWGCGRGTGHWSLEEVIFSFLCVVVVSRKPTWRSIGLDNRQTQNKKSVPAWRSLQYKCKAETDKTRKQRKRDEITSCFHARLT